MKRTSSFISPKKDSTASELSSPSSSTSSSSSSSSSEVHSTSHLSSISSAALRSKAVIPNSVMLKLVLSMITLFVAPLFTYFSSLWYWFPQNATYSGILAIVVANLVILGYIIMAAFEEDPKLATHQESKKEK